MKYEELFSMDGYEFLNWLDESFPACQMEIVKTSEDMEKASDELMRLTNLYAYITELLSWAKLYTRQLKRIGDKILYEDMVDKKEAIENKMNALSQSYKGLSRAVTIKLESNQELRMTGMRYTA